MAKQPTSARHTDFDETREDRVRRLREEVRGGRYQVDNERLALCILARATEQVVNQLSRRGQQPRAGC